MKLKKRPTFISTFLHCEQLIFLLMSFFFFSFFFFPEQIATNCSHSCPCSASKNIEETTENTEAIVKYPIKYNDTIVDDIQKDNCGTYLTPYLHPGIWILIIMVGIFSMTVISLLSLVYGSKNPGKVQLFMTKLGIQKWIYNSK